MSSHTLINYYYLHIMHARFRAEDAHVHRLSLQRPQLPPVLGIVTSHYAEDIDAHDLVLRGTALEEGSDPEITVARERANEIETGKETRKGKRNGAPKSTEKNDEVS